MGRVRVVLPTPHPGQEEVLESRARFRVLACGRRWGKTFLGTGLAVQSAARGERVWWVAPTYKVARVGWRGLLEIVRKIPGIEVRKGDQEIYFPGGGYVGVRSAHDPDSLRGEGLHGVILDEAAIISKVAWEEALRPTLSDTGGWAMFFSTPKGGNWFRGIWMRGQSERFSEWQSWQFPSWTNPHINHDDIEEARQTLPDRIFRQEYGAEFIEDSGLVFRGVTRIIAPVWREKPDGRSTYVFGVDWGKLNDWTVVTVMDVTNKAVVYVDRMNEIDYRLQVKRLQALYERWRPVTIYAERNSMGEPLAEALTALGMPVVPVAVDGKVKPVMIEALALAIEREDIRLPNYEQLILELQAYEAERLQSGRFRYSAPEGYHDDCVMSLALAWHGVTRGTILVGFV